jgi:hypothetical protein
MIPMVSLAVPHIASRWTRHYHDIPAELEAIPWQWRRCYFDPTTLQWHPCYFDATTSHWRSCYFDALFAPITTGTAESGVQWRRCICDATTSQWRPWNFDTHDAPATQ